MFGEFAQAGDSLDEVKFLASYDGKQGYFAMYFQTDPETLRSIIMSREKPSGLSAPFPRQLGWEIPIVDDTLISLLERPGSKAISWEDIDGHRCVRCELGIISEGLSSDHVAVAWFDLANDWLPRLTTIVPSSIWDAGRSGTTIPKPVSPFIFHSIKINEFRSGLDILSGKQRKFPGVLGVRETDKEPTFEVRDVQFNLPVDRSIFRPVIPPGTEIIKNIKTARRTGIVTGGKAGAELFQQRVDKDAEEGSSGEVLPEQRSPPPVVEAIAVSAHPLANQGFGLPNWLLLISILCLIAAVVTKRLI